MTLLQHIDTAAIYGTEPQVGNAVAKVIKVRKNPSTRHTYFQSSFKSHRRVRAQCDQIDTRLFGLDECPRMFDSLPSVCMKSLTSKRQVVMQGISRCVRNLFKVQVEAGLFIYSVWTPYRRFRYLSLLCL